MAGDLNINQQAGGSGSVTQIGVVENYHHYDQRPPSQERSTVTLDFDQAQVDIDKLVELVSKLSGAGVGDIKLVNVRLGSVIVTLEMPTPAAQRLAYLARTQPFLFAGFRLRSVSVDIPVYRGGAAQPPDRRGRPPSPRRGPLARLGRFLQTLIGRLFVIGFVIVVGVGALITIYVYQRENEITARPIACDDPVRDTITDQRYAHEWYFEGEPGQIAAISMANRGGTLAPYLLLEGPDGDRLAASRDTEPGVSAALEVALPGFGRYTITATRAGQASGETNGVYALRLRCEFPGAAPAPTATRRAPTRPPATPTVFLPPTPGFPLRPEYDIDCGAQLDEVITGDRWWVMYVFEAPGGAEVGFEMTRLNGGLDPYLLLLDSDGRIIDEDDDSAGDLNALLDLALPYGDRYYLVATRYGQAGGATTGAYLLQMYCGGSVD